MANTTVAFERLRGLALSASDLRGLTDWPEPLIEDYLSFLDALQTLADAVNVKNDILKTTKLVDTTMSPYELSSTDEEIFFDTTLGDIEANLREGEDGRNYRLISVGTGGNKVILTPFGTDKLFGVNASENIYDGEALIVTFEKDIEDWE